jgi:HTH-like domain
VDRAQEQGMSERWACRLLNQPRGTQRYQLTQREDEDALTRAIVELASQYGRYGYRRSTALLKRDGWQVGKDRVERIWRREGLKVPQKQKPRGRLWFNDGSCIRLRPERPNHVWSYDLPAQFMGAQASTYRPHHSVRSFLLHSAKVAVLRENISFLVHLGKIPGFPSPPPGTGGAVWNRPKEARR